MAASAPDPAFPAPAPSRSSALDLLLGAGGAYLLSIPLLGWWAGRAGGSDWPLALVWGLSILVNAPHYGATLLRVYGRPAERRKYALFAGWVTALLLGSFWWGTWNAWVGSALVTLYFSWSPWHFAAQNFGIALLFLRRQGASVSTPTRRLLQASFALSILLTLLALNVEGSSSLPAPTRSGQAPRIDLLRLGIAPGIAGPVLLASALAYALCLAVAGWRLTREAPPRSLLPVASLVLCQALWFTLPALAQLTGHFDLRTLAFTAIWISAAHSAQYLWVTHHFARRRGEAPRLPAYLARTTLVGNAAFVIPAFLCAPSLLGGNLSFDAGLASLVFALVNLHHFVLDGAIWKLRDGSVTRFLVRGGAPEAGTMPARSGALALRKAIWIVFALCLGVEAGELLRQQAQRLGAPKLASRVLDGLAWVGRDHEIARIRLGRSFLEAGDAESARREFARSADAQPSKAAWGGLGRALERLGDLPAAARAYEAGLAVDPADAELLRSSGFAHRRLGEPAIARERLQDSLRVDPGHHRARRALRSLQAGENSEFPEGNPRGSQNSVDPEATGSAY